MGLLQKLGRNSQPGPGSVLFRPMKVAFHAAHRGRFLQKRAVGKSQAPVWRCWRGKTMGKSRENPPQMEVFMGKSMENMEKMLAKNTITGDFNGKNPLWMGDLPLPRLITGGYIGIEMGRLHMGDVPQCFRFGVLRWLVDTTYLGVYHSNIHPS